MFNNLTDLSIVRNKKQAIVFYFFYMIIFIIIAVSLIAIVNGQSGSGELTYYEGLQFGWSVSIAASMGLAAWICYEKNLHNFGHLILIVVAGALALKAGSLLGLLPATYLSTVKPNLKMSTETK